MKIVYLLFVLLSCTKENILPNNSTGTQRACLLSDKYKKDTSYIRTDTLWKDYVLRDSIAKRISLIQPMWLKICVPDTSYEIWRYVIGTKITYPKIFKK